MDIKNLAQFKFAKIQTSSSILFSDAEFSDFYSFPARYSSSIIENDDEKVKLASSCAEEKGGARAKRMEILV